MSLLRLVVQNYKVVDEKKYGNSEEWRKIKLSVNSHNSYTAIFSGLYFCLRTRASPGLALVLHTIHVLRSNFSVETRIKIQTISQLSLKIRRKGAELKFLLAGSFSLATWNENVTDTISGGIKKRFKYISAAESTKCLCRHNLTLDSTGWTKH